MSSRLPWGLLLLALACGGRTEGDYGTTGGWYAGGSPGYGGTPATGGVIFGGYGGMPATGGAAAGAAAGGAPSGAACGTAAPGCVGPVEPSAKHNQGIKAKTTNRRCFLPNFMRIS